MAPRVISDAPDPKDPWVLASNDYSPATFYTRASDSHGHSANVQVRIPTYFHSQLTAFLREGHLPISSVGEMVRDALLHRMKQLAELVRDPDAARQLNAMRELEQHSARLEYIAAVRDKWEAHIGRVDTVIGGLIRAGELELAWDEIEAASEYTEMTPAYQERLQLVLDEHMESLKAARKRRKSMRLVQGGKASAVGDASGGAGKRRGA